jgi:uncharacterized repeat protein (TIGR01451 family)
MTRFLLTSFGLSKKVFANSSVVTFVVVVVLFAVVLFSSFVIAHSVGQVQTTKFFAPETVAMLQARAAAGNPGLQVGDIVSYIIQFTPVENSGATVGGGGYVTDYIPAGTEVVGAWFVQPDGSGGYNSTAPDLPGPISNGWGPRGVNSYGGTFANNSYDARCAGRPAGQCDGSLAQIYADTGIFFSTDSRTKVFTVPSTDGRVRQGCTTNTPSGNGYNINPTAVGQLNPIIGQSCATTHNLWDAAQTNAFGSSALPTSTTSPTNVSTAPILITAGKIGQGATPFNAGSPVAGPLTGYQLDNTGSVGPWQRISYSGSRTGNPTGPATSATASPTTLGVVDSATAVVGVSTLAGWNLSPSNPLPLSTNAVRWAVGQLTVGDLRYVKLSLRLTATPPTTGINNNSEVFGGDSAEAAGKAGNDNPWRYHVPSVAENNSNLYVLKQVICVYAGVTCVPSDGATLPTNAKVRYRLTYLNTGNAVQTNVVVSDTLPCQTAANAVSNIVVLSGTAFSTTAPVTASGTCGSTPPAGATFSFSPTIASLGPGSGGAVEYNVQTNAGAGDLVTNKAKVVSTELSFGVTSYATSSVANIANLNVSKTVTPSDANPGDTVTYTITVKNVGYVAANSIIINDYLPSAGGNGNTTQFNFVLGSSVISGLTAVTPTLTDPATVSPYGGLNREQATWNFGTQSLAVGASFTIQFQATLGSAVPASTTPYTNDVRGTYNNSSTTDMITATGTAPVSVGFRLSGKVFEDYNYGGGAGRAYDSVLGMYATPNARVELYNSGGNFVTSTSTDASGNYSFAGLNGSSSYTVRVVNSTVVSQRPGGSLCAVALMPCLPVQTFRTNGLTGTVGTADTNRVGGENPLLSDALSNLSNATLASLTTASATPESITAVAVALSNVTGINFGYNFDTVVNTNNSGQGSLRQFIINSNALGGESILMQSGPRTNLGVTQALPSAKETSIFMIANGLARAGLRSGLTNQLTSGVAVINITSLLPALSGSNATKTVIDGSTQSVNVADSNTGLAGAGGTVGVDGLTLAHLYKPEVQIVDAGGLTLGLDVQASDTTLRGISIYGFGNSTTLGEGNIRIGAVNNALLEQNFIGTAATSFTDPGVAVRTGADNIVVMSGNSGIIQNNLIGFANLSGIHLAAATNWTIQTNDVQSNGLSTTTLTSDGITATGNSTALTIIGNLLFDNAGSGIDIGGSAMSIINNTLSGNGVSLVETAGIRLGGAGNDTLYRNIMTTNSGAGVLVRSDSSSNTISQNSIFANGSLGIDLLTASDNQQKGTASFVTLNDSGDADAGGNALFNYPVIESATIQGSSLILKGWTRPNALLEFFIADPDASSFGEGEIYLATLIEGVSDGDASSSSYGPLSVNSITQGQDTTNRFLFTIPLPTGLVAGTNLTATATCLNANSCSSAPDKSTSEFSGLVSVVAENPVVGLAKTLSSIFAVSDSATNHDYTLIYRLTLENFGDVALNNLEIFDNVVTQFGGLNPRDYNLWLAVPENVTLLSPAATLTLNASYNGAATSNVLASGQSLNVGESKLLYLSFVVTVDPAAPVPNNTLRDNSATAKATSPGSQIISDISTSGLDPDGTDNDNTPDETTVTPTSFIKLVKEVRNCGVTVTGCTGAFAVSATGKPGDYLEYHIHLYNISSQSVSSALIEDALLSGVPFQENTYGSIVADKEFLVQCPNASTITLDKTSSATTTSTLIGSPQIVRVDVMNVSACDLAQFNPTEQSSVLFKVRIP